MQTRKKCKEMQDLCKSCDDTEVSLPYFASAPPVISRVLCRQLIYFRDVGIFIGGSSRILQCLVASSLMLEKCRLLLVNYRKVYGLVV